MIWPKLSRDNQSACTRVLMVARWHQSAVVAFCRTGWFQNWCWNGPFGFVHVNHRCVSLSSVVINICTLNLSSVRSRWECWNTFFFYILVIPWLIVKTHPIRVDAPTGHNPINTDLKSPSLLMWICPQVFYSSTLLSCFILASFWLCSEMPEMPDLYDCIKSAVEFFPLDNRR